MALLGNNHPNYRTAARANGSGILGNLRSNFTRAGDTYAMFAGGLGVANTTSVPQGYDFGNGAIVPSPVGGGLAAYTSFSGSVSSANLAMGQAVSAAITGSGSATALLGLIVSFAATLAASGVVSSDLKGVANLALAATASGRISAADLTGLSLMLSNLMGDGALNGDMTGLLSMDSEITVTGATLTTANVADAVWGAIAEGALSYADLQRILLSIAAGKTTGFPTAPVFRDTTDSVDRVSATLDSDGNRTAVVLDPS